MKKLFPILAAAVVAALPIPSLAFSPSCVLGLAKCTLIQGQKIPNDTAERILEECRELTRRNIGARAMRMSVAEVNKVAGSNILHPIFKASHAYSWLHDSPLKFDRSLPYESRYTTVRRACGEAFRDMRVAWPDEEE